MIDLFTKLSVAATMHEQSSQKVGHALLARWVLLFPAPRHLVTDQGANFQSAIVPNLCTIWRIDKLGTTAYNTAGNGACERLNQTIKHGLQKMLNEKMMEDWDVGHTEVMFANNRSVHSTIGFTPYFLMFAVEARIPSEILLGLPEVERSPAS